MQHAHPAAQAADDGFDLDDVPRVHRPPVANALDAGKKRQALAVLGLGQDQDRADLRDRLGQDGRRQGGRLPIAVREIAFVERDVLDSDNPLVDFDLRDAIDEQERIPVREDPLDRSVVERQFQAVHEVASIIGRHDRMPPDTSAQREQEMLTTLIDLGRQVTAVLDFEELVAQIPKLIARLIEFDAFAVYLLDERRAELRVAYSTGYPAPTDGAPAMRLKPGEGLVGAAITSQMPLLVNDVVGDDRYVDMVPGMCSELVVPLLHKKRSIGALNILSHRKDQFTASDVELLRQFAAHVSVGIVNARLFERSRSDAEAFETLAEIGRDVAAVLDLDELFARIAQSMRRVIDYRTFGIWLLNADRAELEIKHAVHYGDHIQQTRIPIGEGLVGYAALHGEPVLVADVSQDPRYINVVADVRSELAIPMLLKDRCIGVLDLESPELDAFTKRDVEILTLLASQAAVAIENARLYETVRANEVRLEKEMHFAQRVQAALLPVGLPKRMKGVEVGARFAPARELGGDFHDFLSPESNMLAVALGDVSGKGVPAALYSVFAAELIRGRTFRRRYLPDRSGPASVLSSVNTILHQRQLEEYYCTLCYAIFDLKRRVVTLANSGLPYPVRSTAEGVSQIELPGVPLGSFQGSTYDELTYALHAGDLFVFCSDGVYEAMNVNGDEYGAERLIEMVARSRELTPRAVVDAIFDAVESFRDGAPPNDDMTAVAVRIG
jgi:sigma-B regulation protein RsbU (phosphoserine phosphatase)